MTPLTLTVRGLRFQLRSPLTVQRVGVCAGVGLLPPTYDTDGGANGRGECPKCSVWFSLRQDGRLWKHGRPT